MEGSREKQNILWVSLPTSYWLNIVTISTKSSLVMLGQVGERKRRKNKSCLKKIRKVHHDVHNKHSLSWKFILEVTHFVILKLSLKLKNVMQFKIYLYLV